MIFLLTKHITLLYNFKQIMIKPGRDTLKSLFSSSIRADLLALLLNNPEERFYMREIATLLRKNPSGVKRELDHLEKMGIVTCNKVANLKYFQAEKKSPLFSELKSLIAKSLGIPGAIKTLLRSSGAKVAFIYGTFAENEDSEKVDLFIAGTSSPSAEGLKDIEDRFSKKINLTFIEEVEFKNRKESGDPDLEKLLSGNKILLAGKL